MIQLVFRMNYNKLSEADTSNKRSICKPPRHCWAHHLTARLATLALTELFLKIKKTFIIESIPQ